MSLLRPSSLLSRLGAAISSIMLGAALANASKQHRPSGDIRNRRIPTGSLFGRAGAARVIHSSGTLKIGASPETVPAAFTKAGFELSRNSPCPCGSHKRFKSCCQVAPVNEPLEQDRMNRRHRREEKRWWQRAYSDRPYPLNVRTGGVIATA